jgi:viroplasmin and RNaseH domain-containing protein
MELTQKEKEDVIWQIVTQLIMYHSSFHPSADLISSHDEIVRYFPTTKEALFEPFNEHANRLGETILDTIENMNMILNREPSLKYELMFREEWEKFKTVGDLYAYFVNLEKTQR